jgi:hypothetical protein
MDDQKAYQERVKNDHFAHKLAIAAVGLYGWQLHGWLTGLLLIIGLVVVISLTNIAILAAAPESRLFAMLRMNRWGWVVLAGIALIYSGASLVSS